MRSQLEFATTVVENRAGRRSWGTIVLSQERTESQERYHRSEKRTNA